MCGFSGFFDSKNKSRHTSRGFDEILHHMGKTLVHRGPNSFQTWVDCDAGIGLAHNRLSIIDTTAHGSQPRSSHCGRYVIAYNGELYNYKAIKKQLSKAYNISWDSDCDTEVFVEAVAHWGLEKSLKSFNGMYAFALYDKKERSLHLGKDPFGKKPLYYGYSNGVLLFGSELKALKKYPAWEGEIDQNALTHFLQFAYVPTPASIYSNIYKLPGGSVASFSYEEVGRGGLPELLKHWSIVDAVSEAKKNPFTGSFEEASSHLHSLMKSAVGVRSYADVPLGAFLSGGYDSSLVTAILQSQGGAPVETFSIGFEEEGYNEAPFAESVAKHLKTNHTSVYAGIDDIKRILPSIHHIYDEPMADSSQFPTLLVSELAAKNVTVALSGDGGDELFCGYNRYVFVEKMYKMFGRYPEALQRCFAFLAKKGIACGPRTFFQKLPYFSGFFPEGRELSYLEKGLSFLPFKDRGDLYLQTISGARNVSPFLSDFVAQPCAIENRNNWPSLGKFEDIMMCLDAQYYLTDDILAKVDRASMHNSLEVRCPILDTRVFSFAWSLPGDYKIQGHNTKRILKDILYQYVPQSLMDRPKSGFSIPLDLWLKNGLRPWANDLVESIRINEGLLQYKPIKKLWDSYLGGAYVAPGFIWTLLMAQNFILHHQDEI